MDTDMINVFLWTEIKSRGRVAAMGSSLFRFPSFRARVTYQGDTALNRVWAERIMGRDLCKLWHHCVCLTSGVSLSSPPAGGRAVRHVLEVCYLHRGVSPETVLKPLHESLHALLILIQRWNTHTQAVIYMSRKTAVVTIIYFCIKKINEREGCEMIYSVNGSSSKEKWGHVSSAYTSVILSYLFMKVLLKRRYTLNDGSRIG